MLGRSYSDWTAACRRTPSRSKVLQASTCQKQENQETFSNSEGTNQDAILPELLLLLGLAVEAVVRLLQQTSKQSFQLLCPADKQDKCQNGGGGGGGAPPQECWGACPSHLSRQVLGSESSPRHMVLGACSPSVLLVLCSERPGLVCPPRGRTALIAPLLGDITAPGQWRERSLGSRRLLDTDFPPV